MKTFDRVGAVIECTVSTVRILDMTILPTIVTTLNLVNDCCIVSKMIYFDSDTGPCDVEVECPQDRVRYYIDSGFQNIKPPRICFNGKE